jgi:nucleoside-diphosphate-sugar epimerase
MTTTLLTGGSGFLGSHIAEQLSREGRKVRALVRKSSDTKFLRSLPNVELAEGAVDDLASFVKAAEGVEYIVHAAGLVKARSEREFMDTNGRGTDNALEAARRTKRSLRRFVLVSSQAVAGPSHDGEPVLESSPPQPITYYGKSKLHGENAAKAAKDELPITIIRPPTVYGPRDREVLAFFKAVKAGVLPVLGSTSTKISLVYGGDAAAACIRAMDADVPSGSVYFVEDGKTRTFAELILGVEGAMKKRAWLRVPLPRGLVEAAAVGSELYGRVANKAVMLTRDKCNELFAPNWVCSAALARSELGWTPKVPFEEGAVITADWYKSAGWL